MQSRTAKHRLNSCLDWRRLTDTYWLLFNFLLGVYNYVRIHNPIIYIILWIENERWYWLFQSYELDN